MKTPSANHGPLEDQRRSMLRAAAHTRIDKCGFLVHTAVFSLTIFFATRGLTGENFHCRKQRLFKACIPLQLAMMAHWHHDIPQQLPQLWPLHFCRQLTLKLLGLLLSPEVQGSIPFWLAILVSHAKIAGQLSILYIKHCLVGGFNPSEKYVSQIGSSSQLLGKIIQMFQTTNQVYIVLTILRNMKVNGKDYPYMKWKNKSHVPNHQPELVSWDYYSQYMEK